MFLGGTYRDKASDTVGLGQYPGGKEYYRYLVKWHTTTDLTPEAIHEIGKKQVAEIYRKLDSIRAATHFKGDLKLFYKLHSSTTSESPSQAHQKFMARTQSNH